MIDVSAVSVRVDDTLVLAPVDLSVAAGESVAVRGENGSGKTTLLRVVAGQIAPTDGCVCIAGEPVDARRGAFRRRVAGAMGPPPFARDVTLQEQLALMAASWGRDVRAARAIAGSTLERLDLGRFGNRFPHQLSSGQRQLAGLATVLVRPFDVLLLDEPEQRLDADRLAIVVSVLREARAAGAAVLTATHSDVIAEETADHVVTLAAA